MEAAAAEALQTLLGALRSRFSHGRSTHFQVTPGPSWLTTRLVELVDPAVRCSKVLPSRSCGTAFQVA